MTTPHQQQPERDAARTYAASQAASLRGALTALKSKTLTALDRKGPRMRRLMFKAVEFLNRYVDLKNDKPALLATAVVVAASAMFFIGNWPAIVR